MSTVVEASTAAARELHSLADQLERHSGFADVLASLAAGHGGTLGGVWGSSCALVAAALEHHAPQTLVVVLPHSRDLDSLCDDLTLFTKARVAQFPAWETDAGERVLNDEIYGRRLRVLKSLSSRDPTDRRSPRIIVTAIQSLMQPVPSAAALAAATRQIKVGDTLDMAELTRWLAAEGCVSTSAVEMAGEFSLRGGILDLFTPDAEHPIRVELFGDEVESLRSFDVATQRSLESLQAVDITVLQPANTNRTHFTAYLPPESWFVLVEPSELQEEGKFYHQRLEKAEDFFSASVCLGEINKFPSVTAAGVPSGSYDTTAHLQFESVERFSGDVHKVREELETAAAEHRVYLVTETEAEAERLAELFSQTKLLQNGQMRFVTGRLARGFRFVQEQVLLISAAELFHREEFARPTQRQTSRAIDSFLQLREGDLVVHLSHGIGRYRGLKLLEKEQGAEAVSYTHLTLPTNREV